MIHCQACGAPMHEAAVSCPSCGRPNSILADVRDDSANTSWFSFRGRISRKEYWLHYVLPLCIIPILAALIDNAVGTAGIFSLIITVVLFIPSLAGAIKRVHDRDRSGWFLLIWLVPLIGPIWMAVELGFLRGTDGANRFGRDRLRGTLPYMVGPAAT